MTNEVTTSELTDDEQALFDRFPGPPISAVIRSTRIWIIEWLPSDEQRTGRLLHEWMQENRPGWSEYTVCKCKKEVLDSIERATKLAKTSGMIPVLHLEAHGNEIGLGLPDRNGNVEILTWDELTEHLQMLNLATRCNLIVVVAACIGFSGIKALVRGPRAPAIALAGPNAEIMSDSLLSGIVEFYKQIVNGKPNFSKMADSASRAAGTTFFDWEPYAVLAYDALAKQVLISMRPNEQQMQIHLIRKRMIEENRWPASEIEHRLSLLGPSLQANILQKTWDELFMIDLYPENRERFGVDWSKEIEMVKDYIYHNRDT